MIKKVTFAILSIIFLIALLFVFWVGGLIMGNAESDSLSKNEKIDYIIILGCRVNGEVPSMALTQRIDAALELLEKFPDSKAVCSGGQGTNEDITEAEAIGRALIEKGIDEERILLEEKSTNTYENLMFSKEILDSRKQEYRAAVVTNNYHVYRTRYLANYLGYENPAVISAPTSPYVFYSGIIREILSVVRCLIVFR